MRNVKKLALIAAIVASLSFLLPIKVSHWFASSARATDVQQSNSNNTPTLSQSCQNQSLPWLQVDGKWIKDGAGNKVTLRGISFCGFNNAWGEQVLPDFKQKITKVTNGTNGWYPNLLRLPIKNYHLDNFSLEQVYQTLQAGVDECVKQQVYCIIDWHAVDGEEGADWRSPEMKRQTKAFWSYIAPRFKDYPNVIFELYNEPSYPKLVSKYNWKIWRSVAQEWVDLIRENSPRNIILIGSPLWSQITRYAPDYPFAGSNLAYVNHTYKGMEESWPKEVGLEYDWEEVFGKAADRVPIFLTEFGWQADAEWEFSKATTAEFGQPMKEFLSKRPNINWVVWTHDHYCSPRLVDESDLVLGGNKMGIFVRQWLQEEWSKPTNPLKSCS
ncbi:MAG: glycoside hydrolase family 5 protein [Pleurocapsa sp.]